MIEGCTEARIFLCDVSTAERTPLVGEVILGSLKLESAWVTKKGYIKGYRIRCVGCGKEREFVYVRHVRDLSVRKCACLRLT